MSIVDSSTSEKASQIAEQLRVLSEELRRAGRYDLLLEAITVPALQQLNIEAAKERLSTLVITSDYRFLLPNYEKEVELSPINKALYIFFLNHEEGVEFKCLSDYREELIALYRKVGNRVSDDIICESIERLVNPLDNSINEKCARIRAAYVGQFDDYMAKSYYIDGPRGYAKKIALPRNMVVWE